MHIFLFKSVRRVNKTKSRNSSLTLCLSKCPKILCSRFIDSSTGNGKWARHMFPVCYLPFIYAQLTQLQVRHAASANGPRTRVYPAFIIITSPEIYRQKKSREENKNKKRDRWWWWWKLMNALGLSEILQLWLMF